MSRWAEAGLAIPISPVLPAVTCSVQATYLTGKLPSEHGTPMAGISVMSVKLSFGDSLTNSLHKENFD